MNEFQQEAYCGWIKNSNELSESSSGGIFFSFARKVLEDGGYVAGAIYSDDYKSVRHIVSNSIDDIKKMRGSKYSQSSYLNVIGKIDEVCKSGKKVLFSGTPCQCYVVKKKVDSPRLICVDLICNGLQDHRVLEKEIERLEQIAGDKIVFYTMRYKKNRMQLPIYTRAEFKNGIQYEEQLYKSVLGKIYGSRLALQKSCYHCPFKGISRVGDITLGDFRGFRILSDIKINQHGASTIITNSETGKQLLNSVRSDLELIKAEKFRSVICSNNRIVISGYKPSDSTIRKFWIILDEAGIEEAAKLSERYLSRSGNIIRKIVDLALLKRYLVANKRFL